MWKSPVLPLLVVGGLLPAFASNPGQPLDCSDWVFLEPGLSCAYWYQYPCPASLLWCVPPVTGSALDNLGRLYRVESAVLSQCPLPTNVSVQRHALIAFDGSSETVVAYIDERCNASYTDKLDLSGGSTVFFEESGRLVLPRLLSLGCTSSNCGPAAGAYDSVEWGAMFVGFPTTFEILQTYRPTANQISFRVPYMPEGFAAADWFDTYYGDLATVGDWSQAQPLECGYPATAPSVGDYLTVEDNLPVLEPGQGRYYVTAVNYQGQRRYGRKSTGGVLSGRDPAVLPGCQR